MKHRIRYAKHTDLDTLLAIDQECFSRGIAFEAWELGYYVALPAAITLIAEVENHIAGFAILNVEKSLATLVTIDIVRQFRRRGLGSSLLEQCEQVLWQQGVSLLRLQVATRNSIAVSFYTVHGFTIVEKLEAYYGTAQDAYLMQKPLGNDDGSRDPKRNV